jgi:hypothetical protein
MIKIDRAHNEFKSISWVLLARNKKDKTRDAIMYLHSSGSMVTATDGYRLHEFTTDMIPEGNYAVITESKSVIVLEPKEGITYLDTKQIWDNFENPQTTYTKISSYKDCNIVFAEIARNLSEKHTVNSKYLADVLECPVTLDLYMDRERVGSAIVFSHWPYRAMLMPTFYK